MIQVSYRLKTAVIIIRTKIVIKGECAEGRWSSFFAAPSSVDWVHNVLNTNMPSLCFALMGQSLMWCTPQSFIVLQSTALADSPGIELVVHIQQRM